MMIEIAIQNIQPNHIEQAILGEQLIFIKDGQKYRVQVTHEQKNRALKVPVFGIAKGQIKIADDFDEPLDCFKEYM